LSDDPGELVIDDLDREAVRDEMEQGRQEFRRLLGKATKADLARPSDGTKWTNQQLLFHMLFGYVIVRSLLVLARAFARLPGGVSTAFARLLDSARKPFHAINYLGSCVGARIIPPSRMAIVMDKVVARLISRLEAEPKSALRRGMRYPTTWDPLFTSYMTLADLYRYPTRHFRYHERQLTLDGTAPGGRGSAAAADVRPVKDTGGPGRSPAGKALTPQQAKRFYERLGRAQDFQAFYEDRAVTELIAAASFPAALSVFELGCGTGRLAENLLARHLLAEARYLGADISDTMVRLSQARLRRFGHRAYLLKADATIPLPVADGVFDRFVVIYVIDLLSRDDAQTVIAQARRMLRPRGLLCAASLAPGQTPAARLVSRTWTRLWTQAPALVGGCRPVSLGPLLDGWDIQHRALVATWGLTTEIIVARPPRRQHENL
jgi:ubiquinone/menaquinone biosynthesis C-methylase UbiE